MGHFTFSLIGLKRILFTNLFQRLQKRHLVRLCKPKEKRISDCSARHFGVGYRLVDADAPQGAFASGNPEDAVQAALAL